MQNIYYVNYSPLQAERVYPGMIGLVYIFQCIEGMLKPWKGRSHVKISAMFVRKLESHERNQHDRGSSFISTPKDLTLNVSHLPPSAGSPGIGLRMGDGLTFQATFRPDLKWFLG